MYISNKVEREACLFAFHQCARVLAKCSARTHIRIIANMTAYYKLFTAKLCK